MFEVTISQREDLSLRDVYLNSSQLSVLSSYSMTWTLLSGLITTKKCKKERLLRRRRHFLFNVWSLKERNEPTVLRHFVAYMWIEDGTATKGKVKNELISKGGLYQFSHLCWSVRCCFNFICRVCRYIRLASSRCSLQHRTRRC